MTFYRRLLLVTCCLFLLQPAVVFSEVVDRIVAVVNEDIITLSELNQALAPYVRKLEASGQSDAEKQQLIYNAAQQLLSRMVDQTITDQEARKLGMNVTDQEVDNAIEQLKKSRLMSQEDLEKALEQEGMTMTAYRDRIRKEILRPKLINYAVKSKVVVTQEDIQAYYEAHSETYGGVRKYHLSNILVPADGIEVDPLTRRRMDAVRDALESGTDFAAVAQEYSSAPNRREGGYIGEFDLDSLSEDIADAVRPLTQGEYTDFIWTDAGYQIFYVNRLEAEAGTPLESVADEISERLYNQVVEKKFADWLETLREKSYIKRML